MRNEPTLWCDGIEDSMAPHGIRHAEAVMTPRGYVAQSGCPQWTQGGSDARTIRRTATRDGWKRIAGRDYSPQCARLLAGEVQSNG